MNNPKVSLSVQVRFLRSVTTRHKPAPLMRVMLARFPGRLLPAHPATFKVGWPPGPFIEQKVGGPRNAAVDV